MSTNAAITTTITTGTAYRQQTLHKRIKNRHDAYVTRRRRYDAQREVIVELLRPDLVTGDVGGKGEGAFHNSKLVEGTGPYAAMVWQRGFQGSMVSAKTEWFRAQVEEPPQATGVQFKGNDEINAWLQRFTEHMVRRYKRSTYYDGMPEFTLNGGTVGSPGMFYQHDVARDMVICEVPDYTAVWFDKDIFGRDNAAHVLREWTALEAASFFGVDQLPRSVKDQLRNGDHYSTTQYLQVIYGAGDLIYKDLPAGESVPQTHPWLEHFICLSTSAEDEEKVFRPLNKGPGYFTRPFSTWHYHRNWHEVYSRTMAWWAIYDIRGLNKLWADLFDVADTAARPPFWGLAQLRGQYDLGPEGENYAPNAEQYQYPPMFLDKKARYDIGLDFADRLAEAVRRHFHNDLFLPVSSVVNDKTQPETMFALMKAEAEKVGQLGPQVETYEGQVLSDGFDMMVELELRREPAYPWGALPQPPDLVLEYSDGQISPQFIGQLSMAMRRDREQLKFFRNIGMAEALFMIQPETIHKIKWSEALEGVLESGDFPQSWLVPEDQYQVVIEAMRQRAMQQELAEAAPKMTQAAKNLQGETKKGSPLAVLGGALV